MVRSQPDPVGAVVMTTNNLQEPLLYPDELDSDPTVPNQDGVAIRAQLEAVLAQESEHQLACPKCSTKHMPGELACANCGVIFANGGKTNKLNTKESVPPPVEKWPVGQVFAEDNTTIFLDIAG